ncbi:hypothetical protein LCGC14_2949710 [marine sediment metagenome]|uniref:Uncharacterized protein n=1 Tax=marine sediment metagenome TaxID=412755 RepID=A0A0F8XG92_9ZZZZ
MIHTDVELAEIARITFRNLIQENIRSLTRVRNGKYASKIFKHAQLHRFVNAGILGYVDHYRFYQLTPEARDELDAIRLKRIQGERR